jgi:hypothetical protein
MVTPQLDDGDRDQTALDHDRRVVLRPDGVMRWRGLRPSTCRSMSDCPEPRRLVWLAALRLRCLLRASILPGPAAWLDTATEDRRSVSRAQAAGTRRITTSACDRRVAITLPSIRPEAPRLRLSRSLELFRGWARCTLASDDPW